MNPLVHPSHAMDMQNVSLLQGVWYGTWRCKSCKRHYVHHKTGETWTDDRLKAPCVAGEIVTSNSFQSREGG